MLVLDLSMLFFTLCLLVYAGFMLRNAYFLGQMSKANDLPDASLPFVSIIVPARNEAEHLATCLQALLHQDYPRERLEILLIDDQSEDATTGIGKVYSVRYPQIRFLQTDPGIQKAHKKAALALGVQHAKGEIILQTDADCIVKTGWARAMAGRFKDRTGLVAGPVFLRENDSIFGRLQSLEGLGLAGIGAGSMLAGRPNMVNGANLAYRKSTFEAVQGFHGIDGVASGDDELLMQKIHLNPDWEVSYCGAREAIVETDVQADWMTFRNQRLRWVSKARQYLDRRVNIIQMIAYLAYLSVPIWILCSV
ncbi:MAG: glycosyltransferase, partial [Bacteroidota bacterium]